MLVGVLVLVVLKLFQEHLIVASPPSWKLITPATMVTLTGFSSISKGVRLGRFIRFMHGEAHAVMLQSAGSHLIRQLQNLILTWTIRP